MTVADPALLTIVIRLDNKPASFVREKLFGKETDANALQYRHADRRFFAGLETILNGIKGGVNTANIYVALAGSASPAVRAGGNIACVQATSAGQAVTFNFGGKTIVLTEGVDFARGASNTTEAAALAVAINAHATLGKLFLAVPAVGDCAIANKTGIPGVVLSGGTGFTATQFGASVAAVAGTAQVFPVHLRVNRSAP